MTAKIFFTVCLISLTCVLCAQNSEIVDRQRAIFIYNTVRQVGYPAVNTDYDEFTVALLGDYPLRDEIQKLQAEGRTVNGKPLAVNQFQSIDEIDDVQLVYVHSRLGFSMKNILSHVKSKGILVLSEDYGFHESMINIIGVDGEIRFEVNPALLRSEDFSVPTSFQQLAITSADRWQELYEQSKKSLQMEKAKVAKQNSLIREQRYLMEKQKVRINEQLELIDAKNLTVEQLQVKINEQGEKYAQIVKAHDSLETQLIEEKREIQRKKSEVSELDDRLSRQLVLLDALEKRISSQRELVKNQEAELDYQRKFTLLFVLLFLLSIGSGFVLWRSYRDKKKLNRILEDKNLAIENHSKLLEEKNKEMEQFAFVASHDLQEPLNSIQGLLGFIDESKLDDSGKRGMELIIQSTTRMRELIRGLLEYSKLGRQVPFSEVDCNQVMTNVKANLAQVLKDNEVNLTVSDLPVITGHEVKLTLLFQNLLSNAVKFRKKDVSPEIVINVSEFIDENDRKRWKFMIKDNGIGIEEKFNEKIFLIFQRLHGRAEYEGTGIGLAHCKKIVDLHGGSIWLDSEPGVGSEFYFTL